MRALHADVVGAVRQADDPVVAVGVGPAPKALPAGARYKGSRSCTRVGRRTTTFRAQLGRQTDERASHRAAVVACNDAGDGDQWRQQHKGGDRRRVHGHVDYDAGRFVARGVNGHAVHACAEAGHDIGAVVAEGNGQGPFPVHLRIALGYCIARREVDNIAGYFGLLLARGVYAWHFHGRHHQDLAGPQVDLDGLTAVAEQ